MMDIYSEPFQASDALVGIANPEIQVLEDEDTYGRFSVEPLEEGPRNDYRQFCPPSASQLHRERSDHLGQRSRASSTNTRPWTT